MLAETEKPEITAAMLEELSRHMRLSSGFAADQSADVEAALAASVAHLESVLSLCLIPRRFLWSAVLDAAGGAEAPVAPVRALISVTRATGAETGEAIDASAFKIESLANSSRFSGRAPRGIALDFVFDAGFGADWQTTPADLRRAALILAAENFDQRRATTTREMETRFGVAALIQPWRPLRLGMRRRA
ncbi:MAG: hypothetical protein WD969_14275 [Paracoccaceae bacterium]